MAPARENTSYAPAISCRPKWWVTKRAVSSCPAATIVISRGVENVSTNPVVIVMSLIHRLSRCRVAAAPWTPMLATWPPGRTRRIQASKVAGVPTASNTTSAPRPSVSPATVSATASGPRRASTRTSAPKRFAASSRLTATSTATTWAGE